MKNLDDVNRLLDEAADERGGPARVVGKVLPRSYDAADLLSRPMAEPNYIVRPYVAEGVTLFCGRPKIGKTTALRQLAHVANAGGDFLGEACASAEVWFLSLEEGERLFRKKLSLMNIPADELRGIRVDFEWPQAAEGVKALRERLLARADARPVMIIIDSLQRFRLPQTAKGHAFTEDYNAVKLLSDLCKEFPGLAIVVLHHTTKAVPDDPVAAISGTNGLAAAADAYVIMLKQADRFRMHAGGRLWDRDESDFELKRTSGRWTLSGEWQQPFNTALAPKQQQVMDALRTGAKSNKVLAELTGQSQSALSHLLGKLEDRGMVSRVANGWEIA